MQDKTPPPHESLIHLPPQAYFDEQEALAKLLPIADDLAALVQKARAPQCLHQIQEPSSAEQAAWHAGLDEGRSQAAPAAVAVPDGREEFEEWATLEGYEGFERAMRGTGHYHSIQLEQLWQSWTNSRAALAAPSAKWDFPTLTTAAAPVALPEADALISEVMGLVDEWGMESHLRGEAEIDAHHSEATQEEIDCAKDRASKERAAWKAIESKLRALLATTTRLVLDYPWRDRLLDGRELVRDQQGFAEHPELPLLDEGMKPRAFFAALGVEMKHTMADDDLSMDEYDAMNDAENWSAWIPRPPIGEAWNLVAIFDTEDGPAAWWARAQEATPPAAQDAREFWGVIAPCGEGVFFKNEADARWTQTGHGSGSDGFGVPTIGEAFRESYEDDALDLVRIRITSQAAEEQQ
ncbi:hypothetical protein FSY45_19350 [Comamonas sp. Z1]|uniref:hypothetical protein n=1 Tax=Comamonas sp. Z1 TaxID=2601246 RepID=UPI0011E8641B|nr:hypothetical protein [Comamonas sp. Z1]TYK74322.1 hypothetical protein FSY45_19350 [Comamonas sp. Z1]